MTAESGHLNVYKLASAAGAMWLFLCINPFFMWITPKSPWYIFALGLIFLSTIQFIKGGDLQLIKSKAIICLLLFLFCFYMMMQQFAIGGVLQFLPFMMIVFWDDKATLGVYDYFRYIILFFSVFAIINSILLFIGITIPYISVDGMTSAAYLSDTTLRIHGLAVTGYNLTSEMEGTLIRACGPLQEGGHFGIILGMILIIDNLLQRKINPVILTAGIITFSPAFVILLVSVLLYIFITGENKLKRMLVALSLVGSVLLGFYLLPEDTKDKVVYSIYERNLETVVQTAVEQKSLVDALSERSTLDGEYLYYQFQKADMQTKIFGVGPVGNQIVLSDFRCSIVRYGYLGFTLLLILGFSCVATGKAGAMLIMTVPFLLVLLHRSWMLDSTYIYYLCYTGITVHGMMDRRGRALSLSQVRW